MIFDFDKFAQITASVYPVSPYTLEKSLSVFRYYFEKYEEYTGRPHPPIRASQIVRICQDMPFIDRDYSGGLYADMPVVFHRRSREPWRVTMSLANFMDIYSAKFLNSPRKECEKNGTDAESAESDSGAIVQPIP